MRKTIILLLVILVSGLGYAQTGTAKGFNYKGLVTDNGNVVANAVIGVKIKLKHGSSTKWYEEHTGVHTDDNGIFSVNIGEGTKISGTYLNFESINWQTYSDMKISVEIDSGTGYQTYVNDIPLKSVPYAKYADRAGILDKQTDHGIQLVTTTGTTTHGFHLSKGSNDWYMHMNSGSDYIIRNDAQDVFKISDADNSVWIKGKLRASVSGDSDMKAFIYGKISTSGTIMNGSSDGFSVSRNSTGEYTITFDTPLNTTHYSVVATSYAASIPEVITFSNDQTTSFKLYAWDLSGNPRNTGFQFVVYKK